MRVKKLKWKGDIAKGYNRRYEIEGNVLKAYEGCYTVIYTENKDQEELKKIAQRDYNMLCKRLFKLMFDE